MTHQPPSPNQSITPVSYTINNDGQACLGNIPLSNLATQFGTPLYVHDVETIRQMAAAYTDSLKTNYKGEHCVLFASKANLNLALCGLADQLGLGLDVVSGGELYAAYQAGFPSERIYFNGNNKSADELRLALDKSIGAITVDSTDELHRLARIAQEHPRYGDLNNPKHKVNILIRVCPGIECHTHEYIQTGQDDTKFGIGMHELPPLLHALTHEYKDLIALKGLHAHIGSQIFEEQPFYDLARLMLNIYYNIRQDYDIILPELNLGGGYGIAYTPQDDPPHIPSLMERIAQRLNDYAVKIDFPPPKLLLEPGRSLIATSGMTLYTAGCSKTVPNIRKFVALDGGMGDNIRPSLYQAQYSAVVADKANQPPEETITLAGKYCESGDLLIQHWDAPKIEDGDTIAIFATGAYGESMASNYNKIPRPACVWVDNGEISLVTRRETYDDLLRRDLVPESIQKGRAGKKTT